jgi:Kef-type K+ transport system membrane component KefB
MLALAEPGRGLAPSIAVSQASILRVVLGLALAFVLAIVAAHPLVRRVERRLGLTVLLSSGLPFLALGFVFHLPTVGILSDEVVRDLRPALEFGLGWLGFVVGMQFDVRELDGMPEKTGAVVVAESAIPFVATFVACFLARMVLDPYFVPSDLATHRAYFFETEITDSLRDALALGACAAPAAPVAAMAIARGSGSVAAKIVGRVTALNDVAGVVVLGIICAYFRPADAFGEWHLPHIAWLFVTLGLGGILGILAYVLVRSAKNASEELAYLLGAIGLSAGMSGFLGVSPLVTGAIAGALLTNLPHKNLERLKGTMLDVERPLYLIFLLVAGALWDPRAWEGWALVPIFVFARVSGKLLGAAVAKGTGPEGLPDAGTLGLALSPQSPIAIATIVSYVTLYKPLTAGADVLPWLMTACIGGAVLTELTVQAIARARGGLRFADLREPSAVSFPPSAYVAPSPEPHRPRTTTDPGLG